MTTNITLRTDGPHSPQYRAEVEDALAECARVLVHSTREGAGGLEYPADAYRLIGALCEAIGRVPQLLGQTGAFLKAQAAAGKAGDDERLSCPAGTAAGWSASATAATAGYTPPATPITVTRLPPEPWPLPATRHPLSSPQGGGQ